MNQKEETFKAIGVFITPQSRSIKAIRDKILGVMRQAGEHPDWTVRIHDRLPQADEFPARLDGAVFLADVPAHPGRIARSYIAVEPPTPRKGSVAIDDAAIGRAAASFLIRRGYRSLAFVGSSRPGLVKYSRARGAAFVDEARKEGIGTSVVELDGTTPDFVSALETVASFIARLEKPCGVLACADEIARDVLDACRIAHVKVPDQLALIGVDDETDICESLHPSLTSVRPDFERCGYMAARILARAIRDRKPHPSGRYVYGVKTIVERASTLDLQGGGRLVALAMEIIRKKALHGLTVGDLAQQLNTSPRLLEMRFREIRGHTAKNAILETRLERVRHLLSNANTRIEDIAEECGWNTSIALKSLFKRRYGMSMRDYRKRKADVRALPLTRGRPQTMPG